MDFKGFAIEGEIRAWIFLIMSRLGMIHKF